MAAPFFYQIKMNILIAGASSGIGAKAKALCEEKGWTVYTAGRKEVSGAGHLHFDARHPEIQIPADWPDVFHGILYCPGTINLKPITRLTREDFLDDYQVNVLGFVSLFQAFLPRLKKANGASVVAFSTVAAQVGIGFHASIAAAKGALQALGQSLAAEFAASRIRVNIISPSLTETPLAESLLNSPEKKEASAKRHPLQSIGSADDMAKAALFFLSPDSGWITAQNLVIDGGMSKIR
jgi:NAD(P)-dependent dehydrogenase (short-subunit alcohol dehydrogenase family)